MTDDLALPPWAQAAKPDAPALPQWAQAAKPAGPTGGLGETWARTKELGASVRNDVQDELSLGDSLVAEGKQKFAQPGIGSKLAGAGEIVRGEVNKAASPLTAVWNALGMADPMMTGGEGLHVAGEALKAPEKPVAAPAIKSGEQVFTGPNHAAMREATGLKDPETGFVKQDGQFIGRKEAAAEAIQAGEAAPATTGKGLHSEDLPPEQKPPTVAPAAHTIRFYHGTTAENAEGFSGKTFVSPHYDYAKNYHGNNNNVLYMDLTKEEAVKRGLYDEVNGYPINGTIDDGAAHLKPSLAAHLGKDNAAPLPEWAQKFPAERAKTELKPVEPPKPAISKGAGAKPFEPPKPMNTELPPNVTKLKTKPQNTYEKWFDTLQKEGTHTNLPMDPEARIARAKAQGFNTDLTLYHGTGQNYMEFKIPHGSSEPAVFLADNPKVSQAYASKGAAPQIIPIWAKMVNPKTVDLKGAAYSPQKMSKLLAEAKAAGHDSVIIKNIHDIGGGVQNQYAFFNPGNLRAKYGAAFDPKVKPSQAHMLSSASAKLSEMLEQTIAARQAANPADKPLGVLDYAKRVAKTLQLALAPETTPLGKRAASLFRDKVGSYKRLAQQDMQLMEQFQREVKAMSLDEKLTLQEWIEQGYAGSKQVPMLGAAPIVEALQKIFTKWRNILETAPRTMTMAFIEDYFPHMWKDPEKARAWAQEFMSKQGNSGATKKRKLPTIADGIKAGLEPAFTDPLDATIHYVMNMSRFVAINEILDDAEAMTDVIWRTPGKQPEGWVPLKGRVASKGNGMQAYAPKEWAEVFNNGTTTPTGTWNDILSGAQYVANASAKMKLALSLYHLTNITNEVYANSMTNIVNRLGSKQFKGAALEAVEFAVKPFTSIATGRKLRQAYLNQGTGSTRMQQVAALAARANFDLVGTKGINAEIGSTVHGSALNAFRKGALKMELAAGLKDMMGAPVAGTARAMAKTTHAVLDAMAEPLFKFYIPAVKNGAYFDMLSTWLDAHPLATEEEQVAFAQRAADIIDDRFGEMNTENLFAPQAVKKAASTGFLSYSYTLGTGRSVVGAGLDTAKAARNVGRGAARVAQGGKFRAPGEELWTPKMSYLYIGLPLASAITNSVYQYLKTGKLPQDASEAFHPKTGGVDAATGEDKRAAIPGYMPQFFNFLAHPGQELSNKVNPAISSGAQLLSSQDFRKDPISASTDDNLTMLRKYFDFAVKAVEPIFLGQEGQEGDNISGAERFFGIRPATRAQMDPKGDEDIRRRADLRADAEKAWHEHTASRAREGVPPDWRNKRRFVTDYVRGHTAAWNEKHGVRTYGGTQ